MKLFGLYKPKNFTKFFLLVIILFLGVNINSFGQSVYSTSGTYSWTCPAGITSVDVECWGGGGSGGGVNISGARAVGGGGSGGAYCKATITVVPGNSYTVTVGAGGTAGTGNGNSGGVSWFNTAATIKAVGGAGGSGGTSGTPIGPGAASVTTGNIGGTINYYGGAGGTGPNTSTSGGGGGSANTTVNGTAASGATAGNGSATGGAGLTASGPGNIGANPGSGGGGARVGSGGGTNNGGIGGVGCVTITYGCSGTPAPGNTLSSANPICPNVNFTLTLQNSISGGGITYQWQSSTDGLTWSNISGATSSSLITSQTITTYYHCNVTCSGNTGVSNSLIETTNFMTCYCASTNASTGREDITKVTFGTTLNNITICESLTGTQGTAAGTSVAGSYSDFTANAITTNVSQGAVEPISIIITLCDGSTRTHVVSVYIDFNHDGDFGDAGENFDIYPATSSTTHTISSNITIPGSALLGQTVMRVVCRESSTTGPCLTGTRGETEDYKINIIGGCTPPTTQATSFSSSAIANTTMTVGWTRGNGDRVIVVARAGSAPTDPTSGTSYTANAAYGSGTACGGGFVVYDGTGTSLNLTGLTSETTYYFAVYEYFTTGACYLLTELTGNATTLACTPTVQAITFTSSGITATTMNIGWVRGNGNSVLVVACAGSAPTDPINGTSYTANAAYGSGSACGGGFVVYSGTGTGVSLTGLSSSTTYYFAVYEFNTTYLCYFLTELTGSAATISCSPSVQATFFTSSALNTTTMTVGWTRGNGNRVMIIARAGSAPTDPTNGTSYTANAAYGSGTACGGGFVVYDGTGTSVNLTGLTASTTYYFAIYEYNTSGFCYNLTQLTGNASTTSGSGLAIIGTGTSTVTYPYRGFYEDARSQFIYTAAEILAAGISPGSTINTLAWNVSSKASTAPYTSFTVKIGSTSIAAFSSAAWLAPGWTNVYSANYTVSAIGWQTYTITGGFIWDGSSNIIIEACFDNADYSGDDPTYYTTTTGNTVCYNYSDGVAGCSMAASYTSTSRPNVKFTFTAGAPCSGQPAAMTAVAAPTTICAGASTNLSYTGGTSASGITYQWQSSPAVGGPYTNITGANSGTYTAYPPTNTWYQVIATCPSYIARTSSVVGVTVDGPTYATVPYSTSFETAWIDRCDTRENPDQYWVGTPVTGNMSWRRDDDGAAAAWSLPTSYMYAPAFSQGARSARFHAGSASSGTIGNLDLYMNMSTVLGTKSILFDYINTSGSDHMEVLLSADGGATFPTILNSLTLSPGWNTYNADISSNSATCVIRFRATADYGMTDIGLDNIRVIAPCSGTPNAGTASLAQSSFCSTGNAGLILTGYTLAGGITMQWQASQTIGPYSWTDITGATTATYTAPSVLQTTYYQCVVKCGANAAYSNVVIFTKTAQSILTTNTPVSVACGSNANLTATAGGGASIVWYNAASGGSSIHTGSPYTTPANSLNTTYYCVANSGSSTESGGMPAKGNTYGYLYTGYGILFDATQAFTLLNCTVYPIGNGNITIQIQNSSGTPLWTSPSTAVNGGASGNPVVVNINYAVAVGTAYRLVISAYSGAGLTDMIYDYTTSFPYPSPSGALNVTSGWYGTGTSSTNYIFYNLNISIPCESTPRTPINVFVTGAAKPACAGSFVPANNATGICPVSTVISWGAVTTACAAASSYKLYFGTDPLLVTANIINGTDIGNVTSYNLGTLSGSTAYYWKIVPTNTTGDAVGPCSITKFTTAASPGSICPGLLGTGVTSVAALPYAAGAGTTAGAGNDLTTTNLVTCGSTLYQTGEDKVWYFTPATSGNVSINLSSIGSYTGLTAFEGCPLAAGSCGASPGACVGSAQGYTGNQSLSVCVVAGRTYYVILDSWSTPFNNPYSNLTISAPSGILVPTNDLPCSATALTLGSAATGDNSCSGSSSEPTAPTCWTSGVSNTVWYTVIAPASGQLSVKTSTMGLSDTQIALYSGACGSLTLVSGACNDNQSGCGSTLSSLMTITGLTPGNTYYIVVDGAYDLTGSFSIQAIDPATMTLPVVPGQDCSLPLPTCAPILNVGDPGYANTGNLCDFSGTGNCTSGERASVWYTLDIGATGTLQFNIVPNDYTGTVGSETDYDFLVWKTGGSGTLANCSSISTNSAQGLVACNFSYLGVTGLYPGGNGNPAYNGGTPWDAAYEAPISVTAGDQYVIVIQNYTQSTSGFTIDYTGSSPAGVINISAVPTVVAWTGAMSTAWALADNWGGCGSPNSCATSVVIPGYMPTMPSISTDISVNNLTINPGATLTLKTNKTLTICGNFLNNGTFVVEAGASVIFKGTTAQTCTNNSGTLTIPNVTIWNSGGGVALAGSSGNMIVTGIFTLTSGILTTSSSSMLIMNAGTTLVPATGGTATSFVDGPMQKLGNTAFVFPLGDGTRWARLAMTAPTASTTFQAQYFATPYSSLTPMDLTQGAAILDHVSALEYWQFDRAVGTGNTSVTLYWENSTWSTMFLCASYLDLSVAKWTGSAWTNLNPTGGVITGTCNPGFGTITTQAAVTSFSPFTFGSLKSKVLNPLPIELLSFTGKKQGDVNAIDWKTASEFNNDYFMLMKSKDGINFEDLYKVNGSLNSNSILSYSHIDNAPFDPISFYKLKQVDINGYYTFSNVISINNNSNSDQPELVELYPNPSSTVINIVVYSPEEGEIDLELIDMYGKTVSIERLKVKKGRDILNVDISKFANGVYASKITFIDYNYSDYKRFIKK